MVLFRCDSVYQLMNAIQIKLSLLPEEDADLLLSDHTDFGEIVGRVEQSNIFSSVKRLYSRKKADQYWSFTKEEQKEISHHPEDYVDIKLLEKKYTDFYLSFETAYAKLMYYAMVRKENTLKVHLFEDGMATYVCDVEKRCREDGMDHEFYKDQKFLNNIKRLLVYEPTLFTGPSALPFDIEKIPAIQAKDEKIRQIFFQVFGRGEMPKEPFIFLEEAFLDDKVPSNDLELFLETAKIVGKENIVVKLHPRNKENRFEKYGIHTMKHTSVPWELFLMEHDITQKVLFTVSSNASLTSKLIFGKNMNAIMLYPMFIGKTWLMSNPNFKEYHEKAVKKFNEDRKNIYCPHSFEEIREILKYIGGLQRIEQTR